jgi:flavodoxin
LKRALIIYHSLFGNTGNVAESLSKGLREEGIKVTCVSITDLELEEPLNYDLIAIGSPTHMIRPSKEMKEFLKKLRTIDLKGTFGFSFDTRNESRMNKRSLFVLENSAARSIEGVMKKMKMRIIRPRVSAIVSGREGPLDEEAEETFFRIGKEIGQQLAA